MTLKLHNSIPKDPYIKQLWKVIYISDTFCVTYNTTAKAGQNAVPIAPRGQFLWVAESQIFLWWAVGQIAVPMLFRGQFLW